MRYLPTLILIACIAQGCATINTVPQTVVIPVKQDTIISMRTTISFTPQYRYDASGNIWMYNPPINKYYKLNLIPIK